MPTYNFYCNKCGALLEGRMAFAEAQRGLGHGGCNYQAARVFSPNRNILIPAAFGMDPGWQGPRGDNSAPYSNNNSVHAPKRETFTQAFNANYKKAGGIG